MLISELMAKLEEAKASGGDVETFLSTWDDYGETCIPVDYVDFDDYEDRVILKIS